MINYISLFQDNISDVIYILRILLTFFTVIILIHCIKKEPNSFPKIFLPNHNYEKIAWIIILVMTSTLYGAGAIAYYLLFIRKQKT